MAENQPAILVAVIGITVDADAAGGGGIIARGFESTDGEPRSSRLCQPNEGDPHLGSIATVTGYHIHVTDGEIGHIEDFLVDDAGWSIRYIKVDTRNWWPGARVLISPRSVREIDWADWLIQVDVNRQKIKDGPPYDPSITVDGATKKSS